MFIPGKMAVAFFLFSFRVRQLFHLVMVYRCLSLLSEAQWFLRYLNEPPGRHPPRGLPSIPGHRLNSTAIFEKRHFPGQIDIGMVCAFFPPFEFEFYQDFRPCLLSSIKWLEAHFLPDLPFFLSSSRRQSALFSLAPPNRCGEYRACSNPSPSFFLDRAHLEAWYCDLLGLRLLLFSLTFFPLRVILLSQRDVPLVGRAIVRVPDIPPLFLFFRTPRPSTSTRDVLRATVDSYFRPADHVKCVFSLFTYPNMRSSLVLPRSRSRFFFG